MKHNVDRGQYLILRWVPKGIHRRWLHKALSTDFLKQRELPFLVSHAYSILPPTCFGLHQFLSMSVPSISNLPCLSMKKTNPSFILEPLRQANRDLALHLFWAMPNHSPTEYLGTSPIPGCMHTPLWTMNQFIFPLVITKLKRLYSVIF